MRPTTLSLMFTLICTAAIEVSAGPKDGPPATSRGNSVSAPAVGSKLGGTKAPWKRQGIPQADWLLANRLADIQHMRDIAQQNGNQRMLEQAEKLEALARRQYALRNCRALDHHCNKPESP